jgi:Flp pilus assembly protein CpaB
MKQKNVILMVVAVGCGLVAAFLTSQMSAKSNVEQVDVVVAAKDLPVGTTITRTELDKMVKIKKMPKDGLPPAYVTDLEQLVDKRLSRPVRAEETFNPQDLLKGGAITLPPGYNMVSLPLGVGQAAAGFVGPGSRVNVLATIRLSNKLHAFPLLVNMLVIAVDTNTTYKDGGVFPTLSMVSFAVKEKEALVLSLARTRGCSLELMLRHPETSNSNETNEKLDEVIKLLTDDREVIKVVSGNNTETPDGGTAKPDVKTEPNPKAEVKPEPPQIAPVPEIAVIKVLVAKKDIEPNTLLTTDLVADAFEEKELPKDFASDALTDFNQAMGKAFKHGVSKGQWVTWSMLGIEKPKPSPQYFFSEPKPAEVTPNPNPVKPVEVKPVRRATHDVAVHTPSGTIIHRYEEVAPGVWKKVAELTPEQAAKSAQQPEAKPDAKPAPDGRKID